MRICNLWRNVSVLLVAGCICCAMPSCSDDDAPAVIEAAQPCASAYELDEVGDVALEFEVIPENAQVNEVKIIGENRAFEAQGFTSKGGGKWLLNARVTDFTQIKQENTVILSVRQTGGAASEVELVVTDPYTIENKFTLANPKGFNYYSADKENLYETGLPVVIAAEKQEDLALIDSKNIKVVDGAVSHKVGAVHFNIIPMTEETGFTLNMNPEKLEEVQEAIPTYSTLDFNVQLTSKNSRVASLPLTVTACAPQATVEDDALTLSRSDLGNPDFEKGFDIDVTHKLRQMGILEKSGFKVKSLGLLDENGKSVDDGPFIETQLEIMDAEGNTKCSVSLTGDARYNYAPGTYYYVLRCRQPWEYNGKTYNPSCANLKFKIVIK
ncbi:hypothetical protein [Bacteroides cellulosilyticus]|jgi:hypothetical protein|uniref:hypothetical protein n=1 Tax=Bacteroides cellulosilyticus TaxID=246787 RepID=UPI000E54C91E|nr:hypothetical protein [Bacteroides cellulosilyticus]RGU30799.1 hypothetical protein DWW88_01560 [Bacteroides cellulosilyticus]